MRKLWHRILWLLSFTERKSFAEWKSHPFLRDIEDYRSVIQPSLLDGTRVAQVLQTKFLLPFQIPFPETFLPHMYEGGDVYSFTFSLLESRKLHSVSIRNIDPIEVPTFNTQVEVFISVSSLAFMDNAILDTKFDTMLEQLNALIISYSIWSKDNSCYRITRPMIELGIPMYIHSGNLLNTEDRLFYLTNPLVEVKNDFIDDESCGEVMRHAQVLVDDVNPFMLSEEFLMTARRQFKQGLYNECIISAQTSCEVYFSHLSIQLQVAEGKPIADVTPSVLNMGFKNILKTTFSSRIGGIWDPDNPQSFLSNYWNDLYVTRNKVVHEGYTPNFDDCLLALDRVLDARRGCWNLLEKAPAPYHTVKAFFVP